MGTRGTTGFQIDGVRKSSYQQYDSYLDGVGLDVLAFTRRIASGEVDRERVNTLARELKLVDESAIPEASEFATIGNVYLNANVSAGNDWYAILRETQGHPDLILDSGFAAGNGSFQNEEYDYVINLDADTLDVYAYGQKLGSLAFAELPTDEEFVKLADQIES
jgi:hypothetical protein